MRRIGIGYIIGALFILVGIAFVWGGFHMLFSDWRFAQIAIPAQGTIAEINRSSVSTSQGGSETRFYPVVHFQTPDGKTIEFVGGGSSQPGYIVGDAVPVLYNPNRPNEARIKTSIPGTLLSLLFPAFGLLALCIGILTFTGPIYTRRKRAWLQRNGRLMNVPLLRVDTIKDSSGAASYFIIAQWQNPDDQKLYIFSSGQVVFDPTPYVTDKQLPIYIDPKNPNRYFMDLSFLPAIG